MFQVHGIDVAEKVVVRKQLRRSQVLAFFKALPPRLIGMEASLTIGSANSRSLVTDAGERQAIDEAGANRIDGNREDDRYGVGYLQQLFQWGIGSDQNDIRSKRDQFRRVFAQVGSAAFGKAGVKPNVAAFDPAHFLKRLLECCEVHPWSRIVRACGREHADQPNVFALLSPHGERPRDRRSAEPCNEFPPCDY